MATYRREIKVGEVVQLKSGGPDMTVQELQDGAKNRTDNSDPGKVRHVRVQWMDNTHRMQTAVIPLESLEGFEAEDRKGDGQGDQDGSVDPRLATSTGTRGPKKDERTGHPYETRPDGATWDADRQANLYPDRTNPGEIAPQAKVQPQRDYSDKQSENASGAGKPGPGSNNH